MLVSAFGYFCYNYITIFSIPPIGALPEGATIVIWKDERMEFLDSAEWMCLRIEEDSSNICQFKYLSMVMQGPDPILKLSYTKQFDPLG